MSDLTTKAAEIRAGLVAEWRKAMEGVTPGPWEVAAEGTYPPCEGSKVLGPQGQNSFGHPVRYFVAQFVSEGNNAWIARCSPAGIASLLALIEQQAAELAAERQSHQNTRDSRERWKVSTFTELRRARTSESERDELLREKERLGAGLRDEREACARICETQSEADPDKEDHCSDYLAGFATGGNATASYLAAAIRARSALAPLGEE